MALIDNLLSWYNLDDNLATTNVIDILENHNGTANRNTDQFNTTGLIDGALDFNGSSDKVDLNDANAFDFVTASDFSFSFWVKPVSWTNGDRMFSNDDTTNGYQIIAVTGDKVQFWGNGGGITTSDDTITIGSWNHIVVTCASGSVKIYINNGTPKTGSTTINASGNDLFIGADASGVGPKYDGDMDLAGIWDKILTAQEVSELNNVGDGFAYPFITIAQSTSFESNNGTFVSAILTPTLTGNTPTFRMRADKTKSFEDVSEGVRHFFANSGSEVQWQAEGNGTTIQNIKIEAFP